jgi:hypothetical protein
MNFTRSDNVNSPSVVKAFQGFHPISNVIETGGMTIDLKLDLSTRIQTYDWHMMYALYGVPTNAGIDEWIGMHRNYQDKLLIDRMFPFIGKREFAIDCKVQVHVSGTQNIKLRVGSRMLRLEMEGMQKDAPILNAANIVAFTSTGKRYEDITVSCLGDE